MHILITGASKGLGFELCLKFGAAGHTIFPLVRNQTSADKLLNAVRGACYPIVADVGEDASINIIKQTLQAHTDRLDMVINNAGIISSTSDSSLDQVTTDTIAELVNVHCLGAVRCVKACQSFLLRSDKPIVLNISSRLGSLARTHHNDYGIRNHSYSYAIAKAAQNMFTVCLDREWSDQGVATYAIHPGVFESALNHGTFDWTAEDAANNLLDWLQQDPTARHRSGTFVFPNHEEIPW